MTDSASVKTRRKTRRAAGSLVLAACLLVPSAGCKDPYLCPVVDEEMLADVPDRLSRTGLYTDILTGEISPGVLHFRPQFPLWADGAEKRRWLQLPAGEVIDTSDMDAWRFPEGTRLWKEFSRDGVALETRLLMKTGPGAGDWSAIAYVWNDEAADAIVAANGFIDAGGTSHNVPAAGECIGCHGGRTSFVLGASAIQLHYEGGPGEIDLTDLEDLGLLSDPPTASLAVPGSVTERAALGTLHANCGHCHNSDRPDEELAPCMDPTSDLDFWLTAGDLASPAATPTYQTMEETTVVPGDPEGSLLIQRISTRQIWDRMPPMGSEVVDDQAVALLTRWIEEMP
jgi:hypothetical protein